MVNYKNNIINNFFDKYLRTAKNEFIKERQISSAKAGRFPIAKTQLKDTNLIIFSSKKYDFNVKELERKKREKEREAKSKKKIYLNSPSEGKTAEKRSNSFNQSKLDKNWSRNIDPPQNFDSKSSFENFNYKEIKKQFSLKKLNRQEILPSPSPKHFENLISEKKELDNSKSVNSFELDTSQEDINKVISNKSKYPLKVKFKQNTNMDNITILETNYEHELDTNRIQQDKNLIKSNHLEPKKRLGQLTLDDCILIGSSKFQRVNSIAKTKPQNKSRKDFNNFDDYYKYKLSKETSSYNKNKRSIANLKKADIFIPELKKKNGCSNVIREISTEKKQEENQIKSSLFNEVLIGYNIKNKSKLIDNDFKEIKRLKERVSSAAKFRTNCQLSNANKMQETNQKILYTETKDTYESCFTDIKKSSDYSITTKNNCIQNKIFSNNGYYTYYNCLSQDYLSTIGGKDFCKTKDLTELYLKEKTLNSKLYSDFVLYKPLHSQNPPLKNKVLTSEFFSNYNMLSSTNNNFSELVKTDKTSLILEKECFDIQSKSKVMERISTGKNKKTSLFKNQLVYQYPKINIMDLKIDKSITSTNNSQI